MPSLTLKYTQDKATPGTMRFAEVVEDEGVETMPTLYMKKDAFEALGQPETLTVTVDAD